MEVKEEDISPEFNAHHLTKTKSKGKLRFSSPNLFQMLKQVIEFYIVDFCGAGDIVQQDSFRDILYTLCVNKLPKVGCDSHFLKLMTYDFMIIRYKYSSKQYSTFISDSWLVSWLAFGIDGLWFESSSLHFILHWLFFLWRKLIVIPRHIVKKIKIPFLIGDIIH